MVEKKFSECRDRWIVSYNGDVVVFDSEESADDYINELKGE